jgi:nicotinate (nicotinamide) nucleotide adenylyltransferase
MAETERQDARPDAAAQSVARLPSDACLPVPAIAVVHDPRDYIDPLSGRRLGDIERGTRTDSPEMGLRELLDLRGIIAVLGGTFDPFHYGHLVTAYAMRPQLVELFKIIKAGPEDVKFLFMPAHRNPQKPDPPLAGDQERYQMIVEALAAHPGFYACDLELRHALPPVWEKQRPGSYTSITIDLLRRLVHKQTQIVWVVGSDWVGGFHTWRRHEDILSMASVAFEVRAGHEDALALIGPHHIRLAPDRHPESSLEARAAKLQLRPWEVSKLDWGVVAVPAVDVSATEIRGILRRCPGALPEKAVRMLPDSVQRLVLAKPSIYGAK